MSRQPGVHILNSDHSQGPPLTTRTAPTEPGSARHGWPSAVEPLLVRRLIDAATIIAMAMLLFDIGDPEFLLNAIWVTIAIGAFVFGLRQTIARLALVTLIMAGVSLLATANGRVTELPLLELTEWPLMIIISLIVALLADRVSTTARRYAALYRQASERLVTAHEEERGRLARNLHDGVGQTLTATIVTLDAADAVLRGDSEREGNEVRRARAGIGQARSLAALALDDVRSVAERLRPPRISEVGLGAAMADLAERAGLPVSVRFRPSVLPPGLLEPDREIDAYRIVQEAIGNAVRHARATLVWIKAEVAEGIATIEVGDDGIGFDRSSAAGLGLANMHERAAILFGVLDVRSKIGAGTVVALRIPLSVAPGPAPGSAGSVEPARSTL